MTIVLTVLLALALGFVVKERAVALLTYLALFGIVFTYQTLSVLLSWMADRPPVAFGPSPQGGFPVTYDSGEAWGYGFVNLVVLAVGAGLVLLGHRLARRRAGKKVAVTVG